MNHHDALGVFRRAGDDDMQLIKRYSISFSQEQAGALEQLAKRNAVSVSWVVRLAVERFLERSRDPQLALDFSAIRDD